MNTPSIWCHGVRLDRTYMYSSVQYRASLYHRINQSVGDCYPRFWVREGVCLGGKICIVLDAIEVLHIHLYTLLYTYIYTFVYCTCICQKLFVPLW